MPARQRCPGHDGTPQYWVSNELVKDHTGLSQTTIVRIWTAHCLRPRSRKGSTGTQSFCGRTELAKFGKGIRIDTDAILELLDHTH